MVPHFPASKGYDIDVTWRLETGRSIFSAVWTTDGVDFHVNWKSAGSKAATAQPFSTRNFVLQAQDSQRRTKLYCGLFKSCRAGDIGN
jgi:hypothetical protein